MPPLQHLGLGKKMQWFGVCTSPRISPASKYCEALWALGNAPQGRKRDGREGGKEWAGGRLSSLDRVKDTLLLNSPYHCHGLPSSQGATPTRDLCIFLVSLFGGVGIGGKSPLRKTVYMALRKTDLWKVMTWDSNGGFVSGRPTCQLYYGAYPSHLSQSVVPRRWQQENSI